MQNSWLELEGKNVIVTGGASGIGKQIVDELVSVGAKTVIADLNVKTGVEVDGAYCIQCDVTKKSSVDDLIAKTAEKFGSVDGIVNNAGVNLPRLLVDYEDKHNEYEMSDKDFDFMVAVNQKGLVLCAQAAVRQMLKQNKGVIVNVASECGQEGSIGQSLYAATKGANMALTRSWAKELGPHNIRVVAIAPGIIEKTALRTNAYNDALAYTRGTTADKLSTDYSKSIPLGREGKLSEIANLVVFLLSDRASYITGTCINISGGKSRG